MNNDRGLRILSLPCDRGGCGWYRIRQPFEQINLHTDSDAHVIDRENDDMLSTAEALSLADVIVVRQGGESGKELLEQSVARYGQEIGQEKKIKAKWVLDLDDNVELISPYSEHYKEYGVREFKDIWVDGKQGFDLTRNRTKIMNLLKGMREVDLITVTTAKLADYARQYNPNVAILPNSIDLAKWWKLPFKENKQLRVGWSGGISHYEDWYAIKEPLNQLLRKYQFKLVSVGAHFGGVIEEENKHLVEIYPWVPFEAHSYRMMCMNLDIAIIPLADLPFNHFKSSIKYLEMAAMGVPSVAPEILPYNEDIENGTTGLTYRSPEEFKIKLERLLTEPEIRETIGNNAGKYVQQYYNAAQTAQLWEKAYRSIL